MGRMTHVGAVVGCDARHRNYRKLVELRETATLYVEADGRRWRKKDGHQTGAYSDRHSSWPPFKLDLSTVRPIRPVAQATAAPQEPSLANPANAYLNKAR